MKYLYRPTVLVVLILAIVFGASLQVNLMLNKKYVVDEIPYTQRVLGLEGIHEIVSIDYLSMMYFNIFCIILIVVFGVIIVFRK